MTTSRTRRIAASLMSGAAALAIAGFTALGSVFDYPKILEAPTSDILTSYQAHHTSITVWFLVLIVGAALLAPVGILLGRITGGRSGSFIAGVGIAAATVQVIGLSRWVLFVPGISADATDPGLSGNAHHTFEQLHFWLGTIVGETIGYTLTAAFTLLAVSSSTRSAIADRRLGYLGYTSAALIATGVLVPLGLGGASITNFVGYIAWCLWLITMAAVLWRSPAATAPTRPAAHLARS